MESSEIIDALKWVVPTLIALGSLIYAIKQRNIVKKEISKKRYLENALSNLKEAIGYLERIKMPNLSTDSDLKEEVGEDNSNNLNVLISEILKASFELKKTKFKLTVSYELTDYGKNAKLYSEKDVRKIRDFGELSHEYLIDLIKSGGMFYIETDTDIPDYQREIVNEIDFNDFKFSLEFIWKAINILSKYEEVYNSISPDSVKNAKRLVEEISSEILQVISTPKEISVDLSKFSKTKEIARYLFENSLNYSPIAHKISEGVSSLVSNLTEVRRQLFLKIS
jgi:hypothetical protein